MNNYYKLQYFTIRKGQGNSRNALAIRIQPKDQLDYRQNQYLKYVTPIAETEYQDGMVPSKSHI